MAYYTRQCLVLPTIRPCTVGASASGAKQTANACVLVSKYMGRIRGQQLVKCRRLRGKPFPSTAPAILYSMYTCVLTYSEAFFFDFICLGIQLVRRI